MPLISPQEELRDGIMALINSVADVGNTYPHYKYSSDWNYFQAQFGWVDNNGNKGIRGTWLTTPSVTTGRFTTFDEPSDAYDWTLRVVMSARDKDDTDSDFMALIYAIRRRIRISLTLGLGEEVVVAGTVTCEIPIVDLRVFGSVLAHYAELRIKFEAYSGISQDEYTS